MSWSLRVSRALRVRFAARPASRFDRCPVVRPASVQHGHGQGVRILAGVLRSGGRGRRLPQRQVQVFDHGHAGQPFGVVARDPLSATAAARMGTKLRGGTYGRHAHAQVLGWRQVRRRCIGVSRTRHVQARWANRAEDFCTVRPLAQRRPGLWPAGWLPRGGMQAGGQGQKLQGIACRSIRDRRLPVAARSSTNRSPTSSVGCGSRGDLGQPSIAVRATPGQRFRCHWDALPDRVIGLRSAPQRRLEDPFHGRAPCRAHPACVRTRTDRLLPPKAKSRESPAQAWSSSAASQSRAKASTWARFNPDTMRAPPLDLLAPIRNVHQVTTTEVDGRGHLCAWRSFSCSPALCHRSLRATSRSATRPDLSSGRNQRRAISTSGVSPVRRQRFAGRNDRRCRAQDR